jgi:hypothetical protein
MIENVKKKKKNNYLDQFHPPHFPLVHKEPGNLGLRGVERGEEGGGRAGWLMPHQKLSGAFVRNSVCFFF